MDGLPIELTPLGDLLMYGGIAFLVILYAVAGLVFRRRSGTK
jgi:hypothetical protein